LKITDLLKSSLPAQVHVLIPVACMVLIHVLFMKFQGFVNAEDISYLVLGRSQELPSSFPALTCVSSCQLTGGKKLPRNFEMLKYF